MRKHLVHAVLVCTVAGVVGSPLAANAAPQHRPPCIRRSWIPQTGMPTAEKQWRVVRLVDCATRKWWPGHARDVLDVLWRESRYDPFATNPRDGVACWAETYGSCGLGQHLIRYWPGRLFYLEPEWFRTWPAKWWNARANVIVTVRMMAAQGGACPAWC